MTSDCVELLTVFLSFPAQRSNTADADLDRCADEDFSGEDALVVFFSLN